MRHRIRSVRWPRRRALPLSVELLEDRSTPSASPASAFDNLNVDANRFDLNHLIVALRPGAVRTDLAAIAPGVVQSSSTLDAASGLVLADLKAGISVAQAQAYFQAQSYVRYAQPDYIVSASVVPNDPNFGSQWGLNNSGQTGGVADADIDAPEAWDIATGGGTVVVAVIDTGVDYNHPDLAANIWTNPGEIAGNGVDDDHNGFVDDVHGWDFANNDSNPIDDNGHGSHVAGIIGAVGNNGIGVSGVIWNVKIMPVKFLAANGSGSLSNAVLALNYAVANGAMISNNSWGGGGFYQPMFDALGSARTAGHIFVAAAGNASSNNDSVATYPANYNLDNVVSVASTTATDGLSSFSNYGATTVELGAPGSSIYSTYMNGGYATLSGTSMATPFVTGAMALVKDQHPDWSYTQIINQVVNNTDRIAALQGKTISGGKLNLYKALTGGQGPTDNAGPKVTTAVFSGTAANTFDKVRLTFDEALAPSSFTTADAVLKFGGTDISGQITGVTAVSGSGDKQFDITFASQSAIGTYSMIVGPDITNVSGNLMNQNGNATNGENPGDQFTATGTISTITTFNSTDVNKTIVDFATTTSVLNVGQNLTIGKITVKMNLNHTWDSDLKISLRSPAGTTVLLTNRRGGSGDNYATTIFDSSAATSIASGVAPFNGTFRPESSLTAFNGQSTSGTWTLTIQDLARLDSGRLNSWSITVTPAGGGTAAAFSDGAGASAGVVAGSAGKHDVPVLMFATPAPTFAPLADVAPSHMQDNPLFQSPSLSENLLYQAREDRAAATGFVETTAVPSNETTSTIGDWLNYDSNDVLNSRI